LQLDQLDLQQGQFVQIRLLGDFLAAGVCCFGAFDWRRLRRLWGDAFDHFVLSLLRLVFLLFFGHNALLAGNSNLRTGG
jgi:hypothetical protein